MAMHMRLSSAHMCTCASPWLARITAARSAPAPHPPAGTTPRFSRPGTPPCSNPNVDDVGMSADGESLGLGPEDIGAIKEQLLNGHDDVEGAVSVALNDFFTDADEQGTRMLKDLEDRLKSFIAGKVIAGAAHSLEPPPCRVPLSL